MIVDNENNQDNMQDMEEVLSSTSISYNVKETDLQDSEEKVWEKISSAMNVQQKNRKYPNGWKYCSIAASIALLIVSGIFIYIHQGNSPDFSQMKIVSNEGKDGKKQIVLPDGSQVWLNAGTQLVYSENFTSDLREVFITGEAFFDVVRDEKRPFIVKSDVVGVKVLGTRFNVKSYAGEDAVEIVLEKGSVYFNKLSDNPNSGITLSPNERAEISKTTGKITIEKIDASFYTSWRDGKLMFKSQTLGMIASVLEKTHNVKIEIKSDNLKNELYTGKFENGETIDQILNIIKLNTPILYSYQNGVYVITKKIN